MATKKQVIDELLEWATKFGVTDESRLDEDVLSFTIDTIRAEVIRKQYAISQQIDTTWLSDLGLVNFHRVNFADDPAVTLCNCPVSKATIPQVISFTSKEGNLDLGIYSVISSCGTKIYNPERMSMWRYAPDDHVCRLFNYYFRINSQMYVNTEVDKLRIMAVLLHPEDGKLFSSQPITSGSIVASTVYVVKNGQVIYDGTTYQADDTFTGTATTTFGGNGTVYKNVQAAAYRDVDPYPASGDMIRMIKLEILTKEFQIERGEVVDALNDSTDDASKGSQ